LTADVIQALAVAGREEAVITDLVKAFGQDMLEEAADKLRRVKRHDLPAMFLGIFMEELGTATDY
jgi:hypothetical protein